MLTGKFCTVQKNGVHQKNRWAMGEVDHPQGAVHIAAAGLACKRAMGQF